MIESLSYVGFTSPNALEWLDFAPAVLGAQISSTSTDPVLVRIDDQRWRIAIHEGDVDDLAYIGWDVGGALELDRDVARLRAASIDVHSGDAELAAERGVQDIAWFRDPFGFRHELSHGAAIGTTPLELGRPSAGFVTGAGGLGHIVLIVPDLEAATSFYLDTLGFELSDDIDMGLLVRFAHCNQRHHTLAFTAIPGMVGVHHLMLEVADPDDVGRAYDIVNDREIPVAMTLGRHTNDEMLSFYVRTPAGFEIEYGSGGRIIDPSEQWVPEQFDAMSLWGHRPPADPLFPSILRPVEVPA